MPIARTYSAAFEHATFLEKNLFSGKHYVNRERASKESLLTVMERVRPHLLAFHITLSGGGLAQ